MFLDYLSDTDKQTNGDCYTIIVCQDAFTKLYNNEVEKFRAEMEKEKERKKEDKLVRRGIRLLSQVFFPQYHKTSHNCFNMEQLPVLIMLMLKRNHSTKITKQYDLIQIVYCFSIRKAWSLHIKQLLALKITITFSHDFADE